ncbi:hypothetical protein KI387_006321, partial [Taxus chinensis]
FLDRFSGVGASYWGLVSLEVGALNQRLHSQWCLHSRAKLVFGLEIVVFYFLEWVLWIGDWCLQKLVLRIRDWSLHSRAELVFGLEIGVF